MINRYVASPFFGKATLIYSEFASADLEDIYGRDMLMNSVELKATTFAHYWLENNGDGAFKWHLLPPESQIGPINAIVPFHYDHDNYTDLLIAGALYDTEVETPRADAGVGLLLKNDQGRGFYSLAPAQSQLIQPGNIKAVQKITVGNKISFLFAGSDEQLQLLSFDKKTPDNSL